MIKTTINQITFEKIDAQRVVIHFLTLSKDYDEALRIAKKIGLGARKYHNKKFGGGIAFNVPFDSSGLEKLSNKIFAQIHARKNPILEA